MIKPNKIGTTKKSRWTVPLPCNVIVFLINIFSSDAFEADTVKCFLHLIDQMLLLDDKIQHCVQLQQASKIANLVSSTTVLIFYT